MTNAPPLWFTWDGKALRPAGAFWIKRVDEFYVTGERYLMAPIEERSVNTHNHFFACVVEAWRNLPEDTAERFPTADHLRKYALIKAAFCDERSIACASKAEALRVAAFIRPMDEYAIVTVREAVVVVYTAKSQSYRSMGKKRFGESKARVLEILAQMIGVGIDDLKRQVPVTDVAGQPVSPFV